MSSMLSAKHEELIIGLRRRLHETPELAHNEFETSKILTEAFAELGLEVRKIRGSTGFVADIVTSRNSPTIALRADMDGLAVQEKKGSGCRSINEGKMHACGHDGHMAIVFGAALMLTSLKNRLKGNVRFIFQPAEEEATVGGAREIISGGGLEGVDCILGLHLWPELPEGVVGYHYGPFFAGLNRFTIAIKGKKFHTARPDLTSDAITAAIQIVQGINGLVNKRSYPWSPHTVTIHSINSNGVAATINGIISSSAFNPAKVAIQPAMDLERIKKTMTNLVDSTCNLYGIRGSIAIKEGYPPLVTEDSVTSVVVNTIKRVLGEENAIESPGTLGGEDFSIYLKTVPGTYLLFGIYNKMLGHTSMLHTPGFSFNEKILAKCAFLMKEAVLDLIDNKSWIP